MSLSEGTQIEENLELYGTDDEQPEIIPYDEDENEDGDIYKPITKLREDTLNGYRIIREIAKGGFGEVFEAEIDIRSTGNCKQIF